MSVTPSNGPKEQASPGTNPFWSDEEDEVDDDVGDTIQNREDSKTKQTDKAHRTDTNSTLSSLASTSVASTDTTAVVQPQIKGKKTDLESQQPNPFMDDSTENNENGNVLMYTKHENIPKKDFGNEVRAILDVEHLLKNSAILLDVNECGLEDIFYRIALEMEISQEKPEFTREEVCNQLLTGRDENTMNLLSRRVQSISAVDGNFDYDQTWISAFCSLSTIQHRHVAIARLLHPTNLGITMEEVQFIVVVVTPSKIKGTKTGLETTKTFASLFADMELRRNLTLASTSDEFRTILNAAAKEAAKGEKQRKRHFTSKEKQSIFGEGTWYPFRGLKEEFVRRLSFYSSDFTDGVRGPRTVQKLLSTTAFLYFACLLPSIAFGALNDDSTNGGINVRKVIIAQGIGGILFALFSGQPLVILLTTAPLSIYIKLIYNISQQLGYDFFAMYACVGVFCQLFLVLYSSTELCSLMKFSRRSVEEMFSLFITIAFSVASFRAVHKIFLKNYSPCAKELENSIIRNISSEVVAEGGVCRRDTAILFILLMLGTLWLGLFLYNFRKTPYLTRSKRELLADYALPASVLVMSFVGSFLFSDVTVDRFKMREDVPIAHVADVFSLSGSGYLLCLLLGFSLSLLFYMDQNISSALVNNPQNKLKKGSGINLDLFVVALINMALSVFGLPWMHGALPHSPLHLRALADVEERVYQGHVQEVITNVRETRLAALIAHILILISAFFLIPYPLQFIPTPVLYGLFLFMAVTSLPGNEMFERILLLFTEQHAYPPTHYIRKVPQRKVHLFTTCQLVQLVILCICGFYPYPFVEMVFPIVVFFFLPMRHTLIPRIIGYKYLEALDGRH